MNQLSSERIQFCLCFVVFSDLFFFKSRVKIIETILRGLCFEPILSDIACSEKTSYHVSTRKIQPGSP